MFFFLNISTFISGLRVNVQACCIGKLVTQGLVCRLFHHSGTKHGTQQFFKKDYFEVRLRGIRIEGKYSSAKIINFQYLFFGKINFFKE